MSNAKPPWRRRHEAPLWLPEWLHLRTCTFCRGIVRYRREQLRTAGTEARRG